MISYLWILSLKLNKTWHFGKLLLRLLVWNSVWKSDTIVSAPMRVWSRAGAWVFSVDFKQSFFVKLTFSSKIILLPRYLTFMNPFWKSISTISFKMGRIPLWWTPIPCFSNSSNHNTYKLLNRFPRKY